MAMQPELKDALLSVGGRAATLTPDRGFSGSLPPHTDDHIEAVTAFLEKRMPSYEGT